MDIRTEGMEAMVKARARLLLTQPFWAALALRLKLVADERHPTGWTDGVHLGFNPRWALRLSRAQAEGFIAHEVAHCALAHVARRGGRDPKGWNVAADHAANLMLLDAGVKLPDGTLHDGRFAGLAAEAIYSALQQEARRQQPQDDKGDRGDDQDRDDDEGAPDEADRGGKDDGEEDGAGTDDDQAGGEDGEGQDAPGDGQGDGEGDRGDDEEADDGSEGTAGGRGEDGDDDEAAPVAHGAVPSGDVRDCPSTEGTPEAVEAAWAVATVQAAKAAVAAGAQVPSAVRALVKELTTPKVDWRAVLREALEKSRSEDYEWSRPSRRFVAAGQYVPALGGRRLGWTAVVVDTSGSIRDGLMREFLAEAQGILDEFQCRMTVVWADDDVCGTQEVGPGETQAWQPRTIRGGTDFTPAFRWVAAQEESPAAVVYLTDLCGPVPGADLDPGCPVVWAVACPPEWRQYQWRPTFGSVVEVPPTAA